MDRRTKYVLYMIALGVYLAANLTLVVVNGKSDEFLEGIDRKFHLLEFWTTALFTMLEFFLLASIRCDHWLSFAVAVVDILLTFVASLLVTLDTEEFEVVAHYFEYVAQILVVALDFVFIHHEMQGNSIRDKYARAFRPITFASLKMLALSGFALVLFAASVVLLAVFAVDPARFDKFSHYLECCIEVANAIVLLLVTYVEFDKTTGYRETKSNDETALPAA